MLATIVGLDDQGYESTRSPFGLAIGTAFVPENTGPDWVLFSDLIPMMQASVLEDTGFTVPGCTVRADSRYDTLRLLIYEAPLAALRLPTYGRFEPGGPDAPVVDPLTGAPLGLALSLAGGMTPLELLVRHVERFVRDHLPKLVNLSDVAQLDAAIGDDGPAILGDARMAIECLDELRRLAQRGAFSDAPEVARRLRSGRDSISAEAYLGVTDSTADLGAEAVSE